MHVLTSMLANRNCNDQPHEIRKKLAIEAKIYSRTDIFLDPRLQRSKRGNNSARTSEQQDMQALGYTTSHAIITVSSY